MKRDQSHVASWPTGLSTHVRIYSHIDTRTYVRTKEKERENEFDVRLLPTTIAACEPVYILYSYVLRVYLEPYYSVPTTLLLIQAATSSFTTTATIVTILVQCLG